MRISATGSTTVQSVEVTAAKGRLLIAGITACDEALWQLETDYPD